MSKIKNILNKSYCECDKISPYLYVFNCFFTVCKILKMHSDKIWEIKLL